MKPNDDRSTPSKCCKGRLRGLPLGPWGAVTGAGSISGLPLRCPSYLRVFRWGVRRHRHQFPQGSCDQWKRGFDRFITGSHHRASGLGITSTPVAIEKDAEIEVATLDWGFPLDPVWQFQRKRRKRRRLDGRRSVKTPATV